MVGDATATPAPGVDHRVAAVVVTYRSDEVLQSCLASLDRNLVRSVVVVDNDGQADPHPVGDLALDVVRPGANLGYGRGVNRGAAAAPPREFLLVSNPDVTYDDGAVAALVAALDANAGAAVVGPTITDASGARYPSVRVFPNVMVAAAHAVLSSRWPQNPFTRVYRSPAKDGGVDWVSGASFLIRREAFESVGGFDERYFMFAEDMDLCWRVARAGWSIIATDAARVTHLEGVSRQGSARRMLVAHHRSALRFEWQRASGVRRLLYPLAAALLLARLGVLWLTAPRRVA